MHSFSPAGFQQARYVFLGKAPVLELHIRSSAPIILFYPGSMLEPAHYSVLLRYLYAAGFSICALHLSGHGLAYKSRGFTFGSLAHEGLAASKWLRTHLGEPIVIAGHSQGAILSLAHAALWPEAACFPIAGTWPHLEEAASLTIFSRWAKHRDKFLNHMAKIARYLPNLPVPLPLYLSIGKIRAGLRKPLLGGKGHFRISYPISYLYSLFSARISEYSASPVCLISATDDALFSRAIMRKTFERLKAPIKDLLWLPGGGHTAVMNPELAALAAMHIQAKCIAYGLNIKTGNFQAED